MTKFGDLISADVPVLLYFYNHIIDTEDNQKTLTDVSAAFGAKAKVIKIDVQKNEQLSEALKVKSCPTFILYHHEEMKWRDSATLSSKKLIQVLNEFVV